MKLGQAVPYTDARSIVEARDDLVEALGGPGLELPPGCEASVTWLLGICDQPTLHDLADVIRAARLHDGLFR